MPKKKLTQEERKNLKLALKKQEEERKRQINRDQLGRELKYAEVNKRRLENEWKELLTKIRLHELQIELDVQINNVERILDYKDYHISILLDTLSAAEDQYNCNFRKHVQNVDNILDVYNKRLDDVKQNFDTEFTNLKECWKYECNKLTNTADTEVGELKTMIFGLETERKNNGKMIYSNYLAKLKFEKSENEDKEDEMREKREECFENMWNNCKTLVKMFKKDRKEMISEYDKIHVHDVETRNIIAKQTIQLFDLQQKLKQLKLTQLFQQEALDLKVNSKRKEFNYFSKIYKTLNKKLMNEITLDNVQLQWLVFQSNKILNVLKPKVKKAETILKSAEITRKNETQMEKILPFPIHFTDEELIKKKRILFDKTLPFWMKCAQSDIVKYHLKDSRHPLEQENVVLKKLVTKYCSGIKHSCG